MMLPMRKSIAFIFSLTFHFLFFGSVFLFQYQSQSAKWSGGNQGSYQVAYVDLSEFESYFPSTSDTDHSSQKEKDHPVKQKKNMQNKISLSGQGHSNTPAGGQGLGLDPDGTVSDTAPSVLALIRKKIMKGKIFPIFAKENHWTGQVKVKFKIKESGQLDFLEILETSGHKILDEAAIRTVKGAAPFPYYPNVIALALEYRLEE